MTAQSCVEISVAISGALSGHKPALATIDSTRGITILTNAGAPGSNGLIDPWALFSVSPGQRIRIARVMATLGTGITLTVAQTSGLKDGDAATVVDAVAGDVQLGTVVVSGRLELIADDIQLYPGQMIRLTTSAVIPAGRAARIQVFFQATRME